MSWKHFPGFGGATMVFLLYLKKLIYTRLNAVCLNVFLLVQVCLFQKLVS